MNKGLAAVILAAGKGTRMRSALPKVLHPLCGAPMLYYPLEAARQADFRQLKVVIGHRSEKVKDAFASDDLTWIEQTDQLGTGHALMCAADSLRGYSGPLLLLCGDVPLLKPGSLKQLQNYHSQQQAAVTVLTAQMPNPQGYGRVIRDGEQILQIVEEKDASEEQRQVTEINTGTYLFDAAFVLSALKGLNKNNAQGEYYLTDVVAAAVAAGKKTRALCIDDPTEVMGINDRCQLAEAEVLMRWKINADLMFGGVSMIDPTTVYIDNGVELGVDTMIHPNVHLRGKTSIGKNCIIETGVVVVDSQIADGVHLKAGSVIEESQIGPSCVIGPMAHLRPGNVLTGNNKIGNFVEMKKSILGEKSQASHLTYIGDSEVGRNVNFGCGTITCNYDGVNKHKTIVEDDVFVGSDCQFVAPVTIGRNSLIAAGSTITKDVPADSLALSRTDQKVIEGWRLRKQKKS
ncbi:MAG: bifunctional UDP-N-acetylglucosamine diphosphorylase/glucosamine-1-phosphate N-acetyltransferase GlmU [Deltaproteobacteria bacterium]|nr:bifunctional UDP-N-acetylglucosamine diphosphorylase/glucosamine-1-phosphate N-acetyltransferase GlmU [Deltaproteobacteria bacterium]MCW8892548.1 bifunctional UDP-N-acetylglucosamine diphosphorylase/glucosamine-1-phosphate N-acetyltransferase GlmU [Deltaproteobacteria bacterium]MCW9050664.1 bifunctional UDP-N-acetylglucosamine diphosphorylase/glucosamine-1-phosphate N-acetyltransferase GlmU [Deltaproteobacteria bacterium]